MLWVLFALVVLWVVVYACVVTLMQWLCPHPASVWRDLRAWRRVRVCLACGRVLETEAVG